MEVVEEVVGDHHFLEGCLANHNKLIDYVRFAVYNTFSRLFHEAPQQSNRMNIIGVPKDEWYPVCFVSTAPNHT